MDRALRRMPVIVPAALLAFIGVESLLVGVLAPPGARIELAALTVLTAGAAFALGALTTARVRPGDPVR